MASRDPDRPNVLVVLSDDQGTWALGSRNPEIRTPVLDRLAADGIRLDAFFSASPVCSPARASLLTGEIPSRHGVHDWIRDGNTGAGATDFLRRRATYVDVLATAGWRCGHVGKWHLGASDQPREPYVHWWAHEKGGGGYHGATMYRGVADADGGEWTGATRETVEGYLTDALADEAGVFLDAEARRAEPFLLHLNFTAPHVPWIDQHPRAYTDLYADTPFVSCPQGPDHPWRLDFSREMDAAYENPRDNLIGYFAATTAMDAGIGRVLDRIDRHGLRESTLVVFLSDNGFNCGHHGLWGKGNATYPANMYDTSVQVPAIVAQPGRVPGGRVSDALVSGYDLLPTLLAYTGVAVPGSYRGPGRSFAALLTGDTTGTQGHVVVHDEYGPTRMLRTRDWKYVHRLPDGPHELYDLASDPDEATNLVDDPRRSGRVAELRGLLDDWFERHGEPAVAAAGLATTGVGQNADGTFWPLPPGEPRWLHRT
ncbi:Arylsulfatase A [Micromonospora sediminicola]|uniref:Arylsulfatase A n=1 Tax=Micromonospora sediminicola TaxID=946078 RepID=A0A1A9BA35_9ACTN|nr:sulfatase-like hydrolase/transferase [Micromonospora sediminicola]SBT65762.1 Arylsulfatase A [Micromonospora sediminicola]